MTTMFIIITITINMASTIFFLFSMKIMIRIMVMERRIMSEIIVITKSIR